MTVATLTREPGRAYLLDIIRDARHRTAAAAYTHLVVEDTRGSIELVV